jgi:hypothetical protein
MNFMQASSTLIGGTTLTALANELGVSTAYLSQARAPASAEHHRSPPDGWEAAVVKLARQRARELTTIAERLSNSGSKRSAGRPKRGRTKARRKR